MVYRAESVGMSSNDNEGREYTGSRRYDNIQITTIGVT